MKRRVKAYNLMSLMLAIAFILASTGVNVHHCHSGDVHVGLFPHLPCSEVTGHCDCKCCHGETEHNEGGHCVDDYFQVDISAPCPHFEPIQIVSFVLPYISTLSASFFESYTELCIPLKTPLILRNPNSVEVLRI